MVAVDTVDTLESLGMIKDGMNILDVGCFIGSWGQTIRDKGYKVNYIGLDVNKISLAKARNRMPEYKFLHMDVNSITYNPHGKLFASTTKFPIEDGWADLVLCHSLFTHMGKFSNAQNYMSEIKRTSKRFGHLWITFFKSPPNDLSNSTKRTVYSTEQISELIEGYGLIDYPTGGNTMDYNDQYMMALYREEE